MHPERRTRLAVVAAILVLAAAMSGPVVLAGKDPECVQACQEQYKADKKACLDAYQARETEINEQRACCVDPFCWQGQWPSQIDCLQDAQRKHNQNVKDKNICFQATQLRARACYEACPDESPLQP